MVAILKRLGSVVLCAVYRRGVLSDVYDVAVSEEENSDCDEGYRGNCNVD
jgi:hypothetical protein